MTFLSCGVYEKELHFFDLSESDFIWTVIVTNDNGSANLFVRNDSILVNLGRLDKRDSTLLERYTIHIAENGDVKELTQYQKSTHEGSMLVHYSSCKESITEYTCKVKLYDSSRIKDLKLKVTGINNRLSSPSDYIEFLNQKGDKDITIDPNSGKLDVYDIIQYSPTKVILLFDYQPGEFDKAGKKRVGILDLTKFLENDGANGAEYVLNKAERLRKLIKK